ncbi:hypothetical protein HDU98_011450, partial [Podochytrium sp. JEL0797]
LILLDASTGEIAVSGFGNLVDKDPTGNHFPYPEKSARTAIGQATTVSEHDSFNGKTLAVYFDATSFAPKVWGKCFAGCGNETNSSTRYECEQCDHFVACESCYTDVVPNSHDKEHTFRVDASPDYLSESLETRDALIKAYTAAQENGDAFEVLMISFDKTPEEHAAHAAQVPWPTVAFDDKFATAFHLARLYDLEFNKTAIVVLDAARGLINKQAALSFKKGAAFPFHPLRFVDFGESEISNNFSIWEKPSLLVFLEATKEPEQVAAVESVLGSVAEQYSPAPAGPVICTDESCEAAPATEADIIFFTVKKQNPMADWFRDSCGLEKKVGAPDAAIFDWTGRGFYGLKGDLTVDALKQFVEDFKSGKLKEVKEAKELKEKEAKELKEKEEKEEKEKADAEAAPALVAAPATWTKTVKTTTITTTTIQDGVETKALKTTTETEFKPNN